MPAGSGGHIPPPAVKVDYLFRWRLNSAIWEITNTTTVVTCCRLPLRRATPRVYTVCRIRVNSLARWNGCLDDMGNAGSIFDGQEHTKWSYEPFVKVGPLRFGMTHEEVASELGEPLAACTYREGIAQNAYFGGIQPKVFAYYGDSGQLACVAIDARLGPQVDLNGLQLVGRVPSQIEDDFIDYAVAHGVHQVSMSQEGDPGADEFGIVLRAQRAGDMLLSRPVFVAREWSVSVCDIQTGFVPDAEWRVR